jgi:hypothetical protein
MKKLIQNIIGCHQCCHLRCDFCFYCTHHDVTVSRNGLDKYVTDINPIIKIEIPEWCPLEDVAE